MPPATSDVPARTALVVDDLRFNRTLLRHTLVALRFEVTEAADGDAAIRLLDNRHFDAVFLDWEMPGAAGGDHVARHVRGLPAEPPTLLIAITGDTSDAMRRRCDSAGVHAFLGKALDLASVEAALAFAAEQQAGSPASPELNRARLHDRLAGYARHFPGGLPEALRQCREEFASEHRRVRTAACAALWTDAARASHNIASLAKIVDIPEVLHAARDCEYALRQHNTAAIPLTLGKLDSLIGRVCADLEASAELTASRG